MKILVVSYAFAPNVGGLERVSETLNAGLLGRGHEIQVITNYLGETGHPYPIWRRPDWPKQRELARWSDVILMHNMSLTYLRLVLTGRKPIVCVSHGDYGFVDRSIRGFLLRSMLRRVECLAVSRYVAGRLPKAATVIRNPLAALPDNASPKINERPRDILFVGRLVHGKGVHVLLEAVRAWPHEPKPSVTIVGEGPEGSALRAMAKDFQLESIRFAGPLPPEAVAREMAKHRVLAIPSVDTEGLPMVALEALAAGAVPVASEIGGLPEVVGECGFLIPPAQTAEWARELPRILADQAGLQAIHDRANAFLEPFRLEVVLDRYEEALRRAGRAKA